MVFGAFWNPSVSISGLRGAQGPAGPSSEPVTATPPCRGFPAHPASGQG